MAFIVKSEKFTESMISEYLCRDDKGGKWASFCQVNNGTGGIGGRNYVDVMRFCLWPSEFWVEAYEIKVQRRDFLNELKKPEKRRFATTFSHVFWFIGPSEIFKLEEIPEDCGLIGLDFAIDQDGKKYITQKILKTAPTRKPSQPSWPFLLSMLRRCSSFTPQVLMASVDDLRNNINSIAWGEETKLRDMFFEEIEFMPDEVIKRMSEKSSRYGYKFESEIHRRELKRKENELLQTNS